MKKFKGILSWIFKIAVSFAIIWLLLTKINFQQVMGLISHISWTSIILVLSLDMVAVLVGAYKWYIFFPEQSFMRIFRISLISRLYSFILPGQLYGEASKVVIFSRTYQHRSKAAASVIIDKLTGLTGVILVGLTGSILSQHHIADNLVFFMFAGFMGIALFFVVVRVNFTFNLLSRLLNFFISKNNFIGKIANKFFSVVESIRNFSSDNPLLIKNLLLSILYQVFTVFYIYVFAKDLNITISVFDLSWIISIVAIATVLPITFAGIGIRDGAFVFFMSSLGVSSEKALALSFTLLALQVYSALVGAGFQLYNIVERKTKGSVAAD